MEQDRIHIKLARRTPEERQADETRRLDPFMRALKAIHTAATPEIESVASMQITSPLTPALTVGGVLSKQEIASLFACTLPAWSVMDTWIVAFSRSSTA